MECILISLNHLRTLAHFPVTQSAGVFDVNRTHLVFHLETKLQPILIQLKQMGASENNQLVVVCSCGSIKVPVSYQSNSKEALCVGSCPKAAFQLNQTSTFIRTGLKLTSV